MLRFYATALNHPLLSAAVLGALSACGFEPLALWPLSLLALGGLLILLGRAQGRGAAAGIGAGFGFGQFAVGLNWIATAFTYQAAMPVWLGWVAVLGLSLYLACYPALAALAAWHARGRIEAMVGVFAGSWTVAEWLRGWVFTGFPWNPLGAVVLGPLDAIGAARLLPWLGTYALSGLVILFAGLWLIALLRFRADRRYLALLPLPMLIQFWPAARDHAPGAGSVSYMLVQPNIPQAELNDPASFELNFRRLAEPLPASQPGHEALILWPESGVSDYLRDGYPPAYYSDTFAGSAAMARARLGRMVGPGRLLLTGAVDLEVSAGRVVGARNVISALDGAGTLRASYAKAHLVPYGEYLPLRALLGPLGLARLVPGDIDFWPGPGPRTLDLGRFGRAGMQICYEIVFPGQVADPAARPDYIFNPTNDGWFGAWGPPQHLAQARMRALEEGLPVLRATTNGISAVIGPDGQVIQSVPSNAAGVLIGRIPSARAPTLFARMGNALSLIWAGVLILLSLVALRLRRE